MVAANAINRADDATLGQIWKVLEQVMDPEVPVISVVDLGIVRDVVRKDTGECVIITPTYSGCPATKQIEADIRSALDQAGFAAVKIETRLSPGWTTDWISEKGREALRSFGIAPPVAKSVKPTMFAAPDLVACPHCGSRQTVQVSEFGSTACKALWKCEACKEPFDYFKCL